LLLLLFNETQTIIAQESIIIIETLRKKKATSINKEPQNGLLKKLSKHY